MDIISKYTEILPGEEWRKAKNREGYLVSNLGRVFSLKSHFKYHYKPIGLLACGENNLGYRTVCLNYVPEKVHRVVAETFIPNPESKPEVNHIDHVRGNNNASNLEWVTHKENIQKSYTVGGRKAPSGCDHYLFGKKATAETKSKMAAAKMGAKHPKFIGYFIINGDRFESANQAGIKIGMSPGTVLKLCKGGNVHGWSFEPKK